MDTREATNLVFFKINNLDPQNAFKIMGYILVNFDYTELIRLASSPDYVLNSLVLSLKQQLKLCSTPLSPSLLNSIPRTPTSTNHNPFSSLIQNPSSHAWPLSSFPNNPISLKSPPLLSYDNMPAGSVSKSSLSSRVMSDSNTAIDSVDEHQMSDYLSFLNESLMKNEEMVDPRIELGPSADNWRSVGDISYHRRSHSASDACFGNEETGNKSCLYFANGFCKNGGDCKFMHSVFTDSVDANVGFPNKFDDGLGLKAAQHQRLVSPSQVMSGPSPYINSVMQQQKDFQRVMMGDEFHKFNRCMLERNDFLAMVSAEKPNSSSRQIYLTFPAESSFKDEDVSEYFSKFGPVQDVRIPYQQKRMFGFVTFVYPETVRVILSKGNPHFICDSRVLVKPYKEKGKILERRQQQLERGEFSPCLSPSGLDSKEPHDLRLGARMFYNPHEILLKKRLEEQAELQQAIELQERRLMKLQLPDLKNNHIRHHQHSLSVGASLPLPQIRNHINNPGLSPDSIKGDITDFGGNLVSTISLAQQQQPLQEVDPSCIHNSESGNKKGRTDSEITDLCNSVEQVLPDSLFASPTKAVADNLPLSDFSTLASESALFSTSSSSHKLQSLTTSSDMASH